MFVICFKVFDKTEPDLCVSDFNEHEFMLGYDPKHAICFETEKQANEWIQDHIAQTENYFTALRSEVIEIYQKWIAGGCIVSKTPKVNRLLSKSYDPDIHDRLDVLDWHIQHVLADDDEIRDEDYKTWPHLYDLFTHIMNVSVYYDKNDIETVSFQMRCKTKSKFEVFQEELSLIIDDNTLIHLDVGIEFKVIQIFEHTLSHWESYVFLYNTNDNHHRICNHRYSLIFEGDLKSCFKYWKTHLYYD